MVPFRIFGMNSCFCSSVPHCRMVGPTRVSPKKSARIGGVAPGEFLVQDDQLDEREALPPVFLGPGGADPAALVELLDPVGVEGLAFLAWSGGTRACPIPRAGSRPASAGPPSGRVRSRADRSGPCSERTAGGLPRPGDGRLVIARAERVLSLHRDRCRADGGQRDHIFESATAARCGPIPADSEVGPYRSPGRVSRRDDPRPWLLLPFCRQDGNSPRGRVWA